MIPSVTGPEPSAGIQAAPVPTMMVDDAASAVTKAEQDRATLVRLIQAGVVLRDPSVGRNVAGAARFRQEIEGLVRPTVNLAIRPKKRRR